MSLRDYKGYEKITERLSKGILGGNVSHAYIIEGDSCIDKMKFTKDFIKGILCEEDLGYGCDICSLCRRIDHDNYEDLYTIEPDGMSVKVWQIAEFCAKLMVKPTGGNRNIGIINHGDSMTMEAQNKLLKTLEEPNEGTVIFILSENTENLLQTVLSRCIIIRLGNLWENLDNEKMEYARKLLEMCENGTYFIEIRNSLNKKIKEKRDATELLDGIERVLREKLLDSKNMTQSREKIIEQVGQVELARRQMMVNVSHKYVIRNLLLKFGGR